MQDDIYQLKETPTAFTEDRSETVFPHIRVPTSSTTTIYKKNFDTGNNSVTDRQIITLNSDGKLVEPYNNVIPEEFEKIEIFPETPPAANKAFLQVISETRAVRLVGTGYPYTIEYLDITDKLNPVVLFSTPITFLSNLSWGWGVQWNPIPAPEITIINTSPAPYMAVLVPCNYDSGASYDSSGYTHYIANYRMLVFSIGTNSFTLVESLQSHFSFRQVITSSPMPPSVENTTFPDDTPPIVKFEDSFINTTGANAFGLLVYESSRWDSDSVLFVGWKICIFSITSGTQTYFKVFTAKERDDYPISSDGWMIAKLIATSNVITDWGIFVMYKTGDYVRYKWLKGYPFGHYDLFSLITNFYDTANSDLSVETIDKRPEIIRVGFPEVPEDTWMFLAHMRDEETNSYHLCARVFYPYNETFSTQPEQKLTTHSASINYSCFRYLNKNTRYLGVQDPATGKLKVFYIPPMNTTSSTPEFNNFILRDIKPLPSIPYQNPINIAYTATHTLLVDSNNIYRIGYKPQSGEDHSYPLGFTLAAAGPNTMVPVALGGIVDGLSGLTPGALYYYDINTKSLTLEDTGILVGKALTETKLFLLLT